MKHFTKMKGKNRLYTISDLKDLESFESYRRDDEVVKPLSFPIYSPDEDTFYGMPELLHTLTYGGTGSGKSTLVIIQQLFAQIKQECPFLYIGSRDGVEATYAYAKENGYRLNVLDYERPEQSDCYNPLDKIYQQFNLNTVGDQHQATTNLRTGLSTMFTSYGKTNDVFWEHSATRAGQGAGNFLLQEGRRSDFNLTNIFKLVDEGMQGQKLQRLYSKYSKMIQSMSPLSTLVHAPSGTAQSIISVFDEKLAEFAQDELISYIFSRNDLPDFEKVKNEKYGLYVILPFTKADTYLSVVKLLLLEVVQSLVSATKKLNDENGKRFLIACDEFASYGFNEISSYISNSRKFNIVWSIAMQSPAQLDQFGDDFKNIIQDNCMIKIYLSMNNVKAMKEISENSGVTTTYYNGEKSIKNLISVDDLQGMPRFSAFIQYKNITLFDFLTPYYKMKGYTKKEYEPRRVIEMRDVKRRNDFSIDEFLNV